MGAFLEVPGTARLTEPFDSYSDRRFLLGTKLVTYDGREFRFGENDGTIEVVGTVYQSEVPNAADDAIAVQAAAAVGARTISLTSNAEAIIVNEFDGGYFIPEDDAGEGFVYLVENTPAGNASATVTIDLAHGIEVALTTATTVMLLKHPGKDVIIDPAPSTAPVYGVAVSPIANNEFGWYQIRGMASVLFEGSLVIGEHVRISEGGTDGLVTNLDYDESGRDDAILGVAMHIGVGAGEHAKILLDIT